MKKKSLFFWFAAFVCAALIFTGCPQEADDDPEPTAAEKAAAELGAALGDAATVSGATVTLAKDYTVASGATLAVPAGVTLAVPGSKTLDVAGTLGVAGTVSVASGGTLKAPALSENGTPKPESLISFTGNGKVELAQGAEGYYGSVLFISAGETGLYKWEGAGGKITLSGSNTTELTEGKVIVRAETGVAPTTTTKIANGATLIVAEDVTFTVNQTSILNVADNANVVVNGKLTTASGATGTNNGTITVESGGIVVSTDDNAVGGTGKTVVKTGGKAYWGGESGDGSTLIAGASSDTTAVFQLGTGATFSFNNTSFGVAGGEVTVATNFTINSKLQVLTIEASGTLILSKIASGNTVSLTLYDEDGTGGAPLVGKPGATVEIKNGAFVEFADETNENDAKNVCTANNFYAATGTKITLTDPGSWNGNVPRDYKPNADETYKWDAAAGGSGTAGWLKETDSA